MSCIHEIFAFLPVQPVYEDARLLMVSFVSRPALTAELTSPLSLSQETFNDTFKRVLDSAPSGDGDE